MALNVKDFDLKAKTVSISKSYQRIKGKDVITKPKTLNSTRIVSSPNFLIEDLEDYFSHIYEVSDRGDYFHTLSIILIMRCNRCASILALRKYSFMI